MDVIEINVIQELNKYSSKGYFTVIKLGEIRKFNLEILDKDAVVQEMIVIVTSNISIETDEKDLLVKLTGAKLRSNLPLGHEMDEWPLLILLANLYTPFIIEKVLLNDPKFKKLVEKRPKISKNSTKHFTIISLQNILSDLFVNVPEQLAAELANKFINHIHLLMSKYKYLDYLPVRERIDFRKQSVADLSFAWEMYFRYIYDQWSEKEIIELPQLNKIFNIDDWSGDFFDRNNPLWFQILNKNKKFNLNKDQKFKINKIWQQWMNGES